MGCCALEQDYRTSRASKSVQPIKTTFGWNINQLQGQSFAIDESNIKLKAQKRMPYRICSSNRLFGNHKYIVKARYVHLVGKGAFSLAIFHFQKDLKDEEGIMTPKIEKVGVEKVVRLFVSKQEAEIQSKGQVQLLPKEWRTSESDTISFTLNMKTRSIEWQKQNTLDKITHRTLLPQSFVNRKLFLELIIYEPEMQLNIQASQTQ